MPLTYFKLFSQTEATSTDNYLATPLLLPSILHSNYTEPCCSFICSYVISKMWFEHFYLTNFVGKPRQARNLSHTVVNSGRAWSNAKPDARNTLTADKYVIIFNHEDRLYCEWRRLKNFLRIMNSKTGSSILLIFNISVAILHICMSSLPKATWYGSMSWWQGPS